MRAQITRLAAASALALLGTGGAQASILGITASGGSETLLNVVRISDSSTMSLDLGDQISQLAIGDTFSLGQNVVNFINGSGGLGGIRFSVIAGGAANGTGVASYLHSTDNAAVSSIANGVRGTWFTNYNGLVTNRLNASNPGDTDPNVDNTYGSFASGVSGNYLTNGTDDWGTASTCVANDNVCNLVAGTLSAQLFLINFGTSPTGFANVQRLLNNGFNGGAKAYIDLGAGQLKIAANVVPVPAAVWLFGSAIGLLGAVRRQQKS